MADMLSYISQEFHPDSIKLLLVAITTSGSQDHVIIIACHDICNSINYIGSE